ncbi:hypothetical protein CF645_37470 [Burkholderia pseudomallei]|nr:hypothetical protein CF645_37470 [Burkholderia pseudomallei]
MHARAPGFHRPWCAAIRADGDMMQHPDLLAGGRRRAGRGAASCPHRLEWPRTMVDESPARERAPAQLDARKNRAPPRGGVSPYLIQLRRRRRTG